jgi:beta-1,4-mannooligosaccharide/beta-1,4-mannosyl-N-acetylglucosamine phosphorylase
MKRYSGNPILTRADIPCLDIRYKDVSSVFNPGAIKLGKEFILLLRVQNRARETLFLKAVSEDGKRFRVIPQEVILTGLSAEDKKIYHIYDPRVTFLEGDYHILTAIDTDQGCFLGWWTSEDFLTLSFKGWVSDSENRNGVLFPEKVAGHFIRFDRPNSAMLENGVSTGSAIRCSLSKDMMQWTPKATVLKGRPHYWDELIGSGPPPIKTRQGWLHLYHGVATHFQSSNIYQAGVSLHPLNAPWETIARGRYNILEPREIYELTGQVPNVVFPSGAIVMDSDSEGFARDNSEVYVYYGAADTCIGLAITTIKELLEAVYA